MKYHNGAVFDWDGVISDSLPAAYAATESLCKMCGVTAPSYAVWLNNFHAPYLPKWRELGITLEYQEILKHYHGFARLEDAAIFPDVKTVFAHLKRSRIPLGIISAGSPATIDALCAKYGIAPYITMRVGRAEEKVTALQNYMQAFDLKSEKVWFVGDFGSDMRDGRLAQVNCVGITRGRPTRDMLVEAGAQHIIDNLRELLPLMGLAEQAEFDFNLQSQYSMV